jgi:hypothetical protein
MRQSKLIKLFFSSLKTFNKLMCIGFLVMLGTQAKAALA